MFTHYMNNLLAVNPAYAGSRDALTVTLLHRAQWVGFEGAPTTQSLTLHSPVYEDMVNLGLSIVNDHVGPVSDQSVYADYAFRFQLTQNSQLALGLKVGFKSVNANLTKLNLNNSIQDIAFSRDLNSGIFPNFGFGVYYSQDRFYFGLSTPRLMENTQMLKDNGVDKIVLKEQRQYFLITGAMYNINEDFDFKPSLFAKVTKGYTPQADLTASFIYQEKVLLGMMYRTGDALGLLAGLNLSNRLHVGYSFDWSFVNQTPKYNYGSHELVLQYDLMSIGKRKIRSPRYF